MKSFAPLFALWLGGQALAAAQAPEPVSSLQPIDLRCEYSPAPLAVEAPRPRLSWSVTSSARAQRQTAYRLLVASAPEHLASDRGDLWDTGKVASDESIHLPYAGEALRSSQQVFWKVRVWDRDGQSSGWSSVATWTMGLGGERAWQAQWITAPAGAEAGLGDCDWIWYPEGDPAKAAPPGTRAFRRSVVLGPDAQVEAAQMLVAADNQFTLFLNGERVGSGEGWQTAAAYDVTRLLTPGTNVLAVAAVNGAAAPNPAGLIAKLIVRLHNREQVTVGTDGSWKCAANESAGWQRTDFSDAAWAAAKVLGKAGIAPWGVINSKSLDPLPLFRREFVVDKPVQRALAHVCGLGFYELHLNGETIGEQVLDPGWTDYRKRCLYATHDVTAQVRRGTNALGVLLGNGMYNVRGGRYVKFTGTFGPPKLILQLHLEFADGTTQDIVSDGAWRTAPGPITFSCIYGGEDYDARREPRGWDRAGFLDTQWRPADRTDGPGGPLAAQTAPPIKVMRRCQPLKVTEPKPGVFVYDLGQNLSGWPQLTVTGPAGTTVKLLPGELLDAQGLVSQRSSGGPTWFAYTLRGEGAETWHPRFSYYGFRYVQVEGAVPQDHAAATAGSAVVLQLESQFTHASARRTGEFECSDELINRIHALILAAIDSNLQSVLTDCPHREKLGWLEVSHLLGPAILFNYDAPQLYAKICDDMAEAQLENGLVPDIAPEYTVFSGGFRDSPEWGSACAVNPWLLYQRYGDLQPLARHYDLIGRYVAYLGTQAKEHLLSHGLGDWYDIGPGGPGESKLTTKGLTATAIYYHDVVILREAAMLLGKPQDAEHWAKLAREIRGAFIGKFFHPATHQYDRGSQTANAMPLALGLVEPDEAAAVLARLVDDVRSRGNQVTAGDVGFRFLVEALRIGGHSQVLFDLVTRREGPGYADQLRKNATSLTEAWDANPDSSQNHCMLGHAEEWFYTGLAGINPDPAGPGFKRIQFKPQPVGTLTWARAAYESIRGRIASEWRIADGRFTLEVTVPANATATVFIPARSESEVTEGGRPLDRAEAVQFLRLEAARGAEPSHAVCAVGAGVYRFAAPSPRAR